MKRRNGNAILPIFLAANDLEDALTLYVELLYRINGALG